jgi:hypothetical protein
MRVRFVAVFQVLFVLLLVPLVVAAQSVRQVSLARSTPFPATLSLFAMTCMSCSTTTTVSPAPCNWAISRATSHGCSPVLGSSRT